MKFNLTTILALLQGDPALAAKLLTPAAMIAGLKLYNDYQTAAADGIINNQEGASLADDAFALVKSASITTDDLAAIWAAVKPLVLANGK